MAPTPTKVKKISQQMLEAIIAEIQSNTENGTYIKKGKLDLTEKGINFEAAKHIAKALKQTTSVKRLILKNNHIKYSGAQTIALAMKENKTIEYVTIEGNFLSSNGATSLKNIWGKYLKSDKRFSSLVEEVEKAPDAKKITFESSSDDEERKGEKKDQPNKQTRDLVTAAPSEPPKTAEKQPTSTAETPSTANAAETTPSTDSTPPNSISISDGEAETAAIEKMQVEEDASQADTSDNDTGEVSNHDSAAHADTATAPSLEVDGKAEASSDSDRDEVVTRNAAIPDAKDDRSAPTPTPQEDQASRQASDTFTATPHGAFFSPGHKDPNSDEETNKMILDLIDHTRGICDLLAATQRSCQQLFLSTFTEKSVANLSALHEFHEHIFLEISGIFQSALVEQEKITVKNFKPLLEEISKKANEDPSKIKYSDIGDVAKHHFASLSEDRSKSSKKKVYLFQTDPSCTITKLKNLVSTLGTLAPNTVLEIPSAKLPENSAPSRSNH